MPLREHRPAPKTLLRLALDDVLPGGGAPDTPSTSAVTTSFSCRWAGRAEGYCGFRVRVQRHRGYASAAQAPAACFVIGFLCDDNDVSLVQLLTGYLCGRALTLILTST